VDTTTRTDVGGGIVTYLIKDLNPPTAGWEPVTFTANGSQSNPVYVYVNAPYRLVSDAIQPWIDCATLSGPAYFGWMSIIYDSIYDRIGYQLTPIDTYGALENRTLLYAGNDWLLGNASQWDAQYRDQQYGGDINWSSYTNKFPDHYGKCSTGSAFPAPAAYLNVNPPVPVNSFTQKFFVGTGDIGYYDGVCVVRQAVTFYTDRGTNSNISSPPGLGYCNPGSYAN
jgi:hypothetical protein